MTHYNLVKLAEKMSAKDRAIEVAKMPINAIKGGIQGGGSGGKVGGTAGAVVGGLSGLATGLSGGKGLKGKLIVTPILGTMGAATGAAIGAGTGALIGVPVGALRGAVVDTYKKATR